MKFKAANVNSEHMSAVVQAAMTRGPDACEVIVNISCDICNSIVTTDFDNNFTDICSFDAALLCCIQASSSCRSCFSTLQQFCQQSLEAPMYFCPAVCQQSFEANTLLSVCVQQLAPCSPDRRCLCRSLHLWHACLGCTQSRKSWRSCPSNSATLRLMARWSRGSVCSQRLSMMLCKL